MVSDMTVEKVVYVQMSSNDTGSLVCLGEFTYLWQMQKVGRVQMQWDTTDMTDAEGSLRPGELKRGRCAGTEVCCAVVHTLHGRTAESCAPLYSTPSSHTVPPPEITTDKSSVHHSTALLHTAISHSASSWNHNRQFIWAPLYCSTSHCHLTQCLLISQQTSRQGTTLLLYFTLPSHTVPPEITTDKCLAHVHSLLYCTPHYAYTTQYATSVGTSTWTSTGAPPPPHTHTQITMKQLIMPASWASYLSISERLCQGEGAEVEGHEDRVKLRGHLMQRLGRLLQLRHQCCELVKHGRLKMEHSNTL